MNGKVRDPAPSKREGKRVTQGSGPTTVNGKVPPRRLPNAARRPREYLTLEEAERLIATARKRVGARNPHRDATLILLAYRHGLRASELCALRWDMLDLSQGRYHVTRRKSLAVRREHALGQDACCRAASTRGSWPASRG
jgi:integrase